MSDADTGYGQVGDEDAVRDAVAVLLATASSRWTGWDRPSRCQLPDCHNLLPPPVDTTGKAKRGTPRRYCTDSHKTADSQRRAALAGAAAGQHTDGIDPDVLRAELREVGTQTVTQVRPALDQLNELLGDLLNRFTTADRSAVALVADARRRAAAAEQAAEQAESRAEAAEARTARAEQQGRLDREAKQRADRAQEAAERAARDADDDRVRADALREAAELKAAAAESRAELSAQATLAATQTAAEQQTRADGLHADLDRERAEHTAEITRLTEQARAAATRAQNSHDQALRELREQADTRLEALRTQQATEIDRIRTATAAEIAAARAETSQATDRYTDAIRDLERERAHSHTTQDRLLRQLRRTLNALLDPPDDDGPDNTDETAIARGQRLREGVTAALRGLDDLADTGEDRDHTEEGDR